MKSGLASISEQLNCPLPLFSSARRRCRFYANLVWIIVVLVSEVFKKKRTLGNTEIKTGLMAQTRLEFSTPEKASANFSPMQGRGYIHTYRTRTPVAFLKVFFTTAGDQIFCTAFILFTTGIRTTSLEIKYMNS